MAKRILIYTNHYYPEQFKINDLVRWLGEDLYKVRVITGLPNYPEGKIYKGFGIFSNLFKTPNSKNLIINRLFLIPRGNGSYPMLIINYLSYLISCLIFTVYIAIFKKKYDIIIVHHTSPFFVSIHPIVYSFFHKSKKILWELDLWPETLRDINIIKSPIFFKKIEKIITKIYSYYDKILVSSYSFKKIVEKRFKGDVLYFPNWADSEIENLEYISLNLKIPKDTFRIMYTGNIGTVQNFQKLTDSIYDLRNNKIHWIFVGAGRFLNEFKKLTEKRNIQNYCTFIPRVKVNQIPSYARYADCMYLSLNDSEIFKKTVPAKLQTYLALGKPILAVISGEGASIITDAKCGYVNQNNNFVDFSKLVIKMSELNDNELKKMGENSLNYYKINFNSSNRKIEIFNLLEQI